MIWLCEIGSCNVSELTLTPLCSLSWAGTRCHPLTEASQMLGLHLCSPGKANLRTTDLEDSRGITSGNLKFKAASLYHVRQMVTSLCEGSKREVLLFVDVQGPSYRLLPSQVFILDSLLWHPEGLQFL